MLFAWPEEPSYQGKSLSQWIRGVEYVNRNPSEEMRRALLAMGEPAVKRLMAILQKHDSILKRKFLDYASKHVELQNRYVATRKVVPEDVYHAEAATALGEMGPVAKDAVAALEMACQDGNFDVASRAKAALIKIRQESIEAALVELANPRSTNWSRLAWMVKYLGTNGEPAVPLLVRALEDTNSGVRQTAAFALGGISSDPEASVPPLLEHLKDSDPAVRRYAVDAVINFKSAKQLIVPALVNSMRDKDLNTWLGASYGLEKLLTSDEKEKVLVPALVESLRSPVPIIRENAALFLRRLNPDIAAREIPRDQNGAK